MKINRYISVICVLFGLLNSCQQPDDLRPPVSRDGINSITAMFADGTGEFVGSLREGNDTIVIPIPYFFPESSNNQVTNEMLRRMRMRANLDDNVVISPALLWMDLTEDNTITLTDQVKAKRDYIITGEIRKSDQCLIEEFTIPSLGLAGVINEITKIISLVTVDAIGEELADVRLSYHATISPDPREVALNYEKDVELTVTAHNGTSSSVYTVQKSIPDKLPYGIRLGSARLMFAKQLNADLGITAEHLTGGIAATKDFVAINTRAENTVYINPKTGEKMGEIDLGSITGNLTNFYNTADNNGNILVCNLAPNAGDFKIWTLKSVNATPELYIEYGGGQAMGRKISIQGSIDDNAIITAPIHDAGQQFARWTVVEGQLTSQTPDIVTMSGLAKGWTTNVDIVYTSDTDVNSDYYVASYSDNTFAWVDGRTNTVHKALDAISTNYVPNAVDYAEFNNAKYVTKNWVNSFTWGAADAIWLMDVTSDATFSGNLETGSCKAVVWECERDIYGPRGISGAPANANATGDVALVTSDDGFFIYVYFMFTNGYVVGYQLDCIDM